MLHASKISWTEASLVSLYGCSAHSPGCRNCYTTSYLRRFQKNRSMNRDGRFDDLFRISKVSGKCSLTGEIVFHPGRLYAALADMKPKLVFVNAFSDLLHEALPLDLILEHFRVFAHAPQHVFQILTKRSERLAELNSAVLAEFGAWPRNVWMGVSVCTAADREMLRIRHLAETAAALRWVSFEPWQSDPYTPLRDSRPDLRGLLRESNIGWVVVGGESGPRDTTALMSLDDARFLVGEGKAVCPVVFKQLGTALAIRLGVYSTHGKGEHRSQGGHPDQWPPDLRVQEYPDPIAPIPCGPSEFRPAFDPGTWIRFGHKTDRARMPGDACSGAQAAPAISEEEDFEDLHVG